MFSKDKFLSGHPQRIISEKDASVSAEEVIERIGAVHFEATAHFFNINCLQL